ncbi:MAG: redoxin family protein [Bacteroidia bacterium]
MNIGDKLINFKLEATDGKWYSNFDFVERYALCFIFTSNTCPQSKAYWQRIVKLADRYEQDNMVLFAVNSNDELQDPNESMQGMKDLMGTLEGENVYYLKDEDQSLAKQMGAEINPEVFLFNSKRELVYKGIIDDSWENENQVMMAYLEDAIEYCLDGIDIDYPEIPAQGCDILWKK